MLDRILVGTRKGTFHVAKSRGSWTVRLLGHGGSGVNFVAKDPNSGVLWAALGHGHWGAKLSVSRDDGKCWQDASQVIYPAGARYLEGAEPGEPVSPSEELGPSVNTAEGQPRPTKLRFKPATIQKLWHIAFGAPGTVYVGTIPGGLFISRDEGETFELNRALWNHESRGGDLFNGEGTGVSHWFGTPASEGGEFAPGIHSIAEDPRDPNRILVAVSTAGVLETTDGGKTWRGRNKGLSMDYLPNALAEWGHDPHYVELCPSQPDHVWQQNHCGVFYSHDGAATWRKVSKPELGIHFGFPIAVDEKDGRTAWVVPGKSDDQRMAINGQLFVGRTQDGGETWEQLRNGLPQQNAYDVVYRHALSLSGDRLAFGSTTGNLYVSEDRGESWSVVSNNLPPIYSVRFA